MFLNITAFSKMASLPALISVKMLNWGQILTDLLYGGSTNDGFKIKITEREKHAF